MTVRKYFSEFGINMVAQLGIILQQDQLSSLGNVGLDENFPFHIYMICRRPKVLIEPDTIEFTNTRVRGRFKIQRKDKFENIDFDVPNQLGANVTFQCAYPYTEFQVLDSQKRVVSSGMSSLLLSKFVSEGHLDYGDYLNLEVLYVGQSYGIEGARTAPQRLRSHSTLQQIYLDVMNRTPDQDVWLVLWSFAEQFLASFDGRSSEYGMTMEEDEKHVHKVLQHEVREQQRINYTEAALIRYFCPEYNDTFKYNFPNPAHTSYADCYELDLNSVCVELVTDEICTQLWSPHVSPQMVHLIQFNLESREKRKDMFQF